MTVKPGIVTKFLSVTKRRTNEMISGQFNTTARRLLRIIPENRKNSALKPKIEGDSRHTYVSIVSE